MCILEQIVFIKVVPCQVEMMTGPLYTPCLIMKCELLQQGHDLG